MLIHYVNDESHKFDTILKCQVKCSACMLIGYKGHTNTKHTGLFHDHYDIVIAFEDGQSSQEKSEPITPVMNACDW